MSDSPDSPRKGLIVVEGPHEEHGAAETLVRRCLPSADRYIWEMERWKNPLRPKARFVSTGKGDGIFKKLIFIMMFAKNNGYDALVVLIDRDGDLRRMKSVNAAQDSQHVQLPHAFGVAVETFDAWFLADEQSLSKVMNATIPTQPSPETIKDPKSQMRALIEQCPTDLSQREVYRQTAEVIDLDRLSKRCNEGFGPWRARLESLDS